MPAHGSSRANLAARDSKRRKSAGDAAIMDGVRSRRLRATPAATPAPFATMATTMLQLLTSMLVLAGVEATRGAAIHSIDASSADAANTVGGACHCRVVARARVLAAARRACARAHRACVHASRARGGRSADSHHHTQCHVHAPRASAVLGHRWSERRRVDQPPPRRLPGGRALGHPGHSLQAKLRRVSATTLADPHPMPCREPRMVLHPVPHASVNPPRLAARRRRRPPECMARPTHGRTTH